MQGEGGRSSVACLQPQGVSGGGVVSGLGPRLLGLLEKANFLSADHDVTVFPGVSWDAGC